MIQKINLFVFYFVFFISIKKTLEYNLQDLMLSIHLYSVIYISCFLFIFFLFRFFEFFKYQINFFFLYLLIFLYISGLLWSFSSWGIYFFGTSWLFLSVCCLFCILYYFYFFLKNTKKWYFIYLIESFWIMLIFYYFLIKNNYQTIHQNTKTIILTEYLMNHDILYLIFYLLLFSFYIFVLVFINAAVWYENRRIAQW